MAKGERGTGKPYLRGEIWWIKYYVDGEPIRESTETSVKAEAVKILNRKRKEADDGKLSANKCRIGDLLELHLKQQKRLQRQDVSHVESRIRKHLRPALGCVWARRFDLSDVEQYIDNRLEAEASPATVNRELAALKTALRIGKRKGLIRDVIEWEKLPEHNIRAGFLDYDDYRRLLGELLHELKPLLVFGYHYGMRKSELLGYKWQYVSWHARELRIPQADIKNKEPKIVPFSGDVEPWLQMERTRHDALYPDSPWIFSRTGKGIRDFRASWAQAVERAACRIR